jgi:hypothetical protein
MGDRGQIEFCFPKGKSVFLYTHDGGLELKQTLAKALKRGESCWNDPEYLLRIIFSEMTMGYSKGRSAFPYTHDGGLDLQQTLAKTLKRRENDPEYLLLLLFSDMIRGYERDTTGVGDHEDLDHPLIRIVNVVPSWIENEELPMVIIGDDQWTFPQFVQEFA